MSEEVLVASSTSQFNEFLDSTVWADMKREMNVWLEGVRDGLENTESNEQDLYRNQGRADALRYVLMIPETIRDTLIENESRKDKEEVKEDV